MLSWWLGAAKISPQDSKVSFISIIKTTKFYIYRPIRLSAKKEITSEVKSQNVKVFDVLKNFLFSVQMSFVPVCTSKSGLAKLALLITSETLTLIHSRSFSVTKGSLFHQISRFVKSKKICPLSNSRMEINVESDF